ncbi:MAG: hypothetical protein NC311_06355 [Muribaculaceae bacterium]|nr:hypothetical protein [Muribaculaceae bacterium]
MDKTAVHIHVRRKTDEVDILLAPHKDGSGYSYVNLTKGHICACKFKTIDEALRDMMERPEVVEFTMTGGGSE